MQRSRRRLLFLVCAVPLLTVAAAFGYIVGMAIFEGQTRGFWDALEFAAETLSTTGYGADARWTHPVMVIFVVLLQFIGIFFVFLIIPIYLVPFLEERFEEKLPRRAPDRMHDHIVVYHYGPAVENLVEQLHDTKGRYIIVDSDEGRARRLVEAGRNVVFVRAEEEATDVCRLDRAKAIVVNAHDEENVSLLLRARQLGFSGEMIALADDPEKRRPMEIAGASAVYTPNHILAAALAARASDRISPRISGIQQIGELELREVRIQLGSSLAGRTLSDAGLGARTGAIVIGQWIGGKLVTELGPSTRLEPQSILIVAGSEEALEKLSALAEGATPLKLDGPYVVAGFGEVGRKVHQLMTDAGEEVLTIDRDPRAGVNIIGTVFDSDVLRAAGVDHAKSVILALDNDDATLFATVIIRDISGRVPVIARVNKARNVENIHRAGADFALSISQVSGQLLAYRLLHQEALSLDQRLKVLKAGGSAFAGRHPAELRVRERTQCSIVAVERGAEVHVEFPPTFRIAENDTVFVCGSEENVRRFTAQFGPRA